MSFFLSTIAIVWAIIALFSYFIFLRVGIVHIALSVVWIPWFPPPTTFTMSASHFNDSEFNISTIT